jgi:linoleoyl-CoA desaturase
VSHVHYPAIRKIVIELANKYGIQHNEFPSFWVALKSHFRMMHELGKTNQVAAA